MTDETKNTDNEDWLADFEENSEDELFSELDQANIDALLGGDEGEPAAAAAEGDDSSEEQGLAQADMDALLGGTVSGVEDKGAELDETAGTADESGELSQSDIDSLMGLGPEDEQTDQQEASGQTEEEEAVSEPEETVQEVEAQEELDQGDIDALMGGGIDEAPEDISEKDETLKALDEISDPETAAPAGPIEEDWSELDQANIDALLGDGASDEISMGINALVDEGLGGAEEPARPEQEVKDDLDAGADEVPSQEDMDKIFSEAGKQETGDEDFSFGVDLPEEAADESEPDILSEAGDDDDFAFTDDDFNFDDDLPELPDIPEEVARVEENQDVIVAEETNYSDSDEATQKIVTPAWMQNITHNKSSVAAIGAAIVLLLGGVLFFFLRGGGEDEVLEVAEQQVETMVAEEREKVPEVHEQQPEPVNTVPAVSGGAVRVASDGREAVVLLAGMDEDGDSLSYEITRQPLYGTLQGEAPNLIYQAGNQFSGEDRFEFRVSDGKDVSSVASIFISGPDIRSMLAAAKEKEAKPKPQRIAAKDVVLEGVSTKEIIIDWPALFRQANDMAYEGNVRVDFDPGSLRGTLEKDGPYRNRYIPDPYYSGTEKITYQFKMGKRKTGRQTLELRIASGNPPPKLQLAALDRTEFVAGEQVLLDASRSVDDDPASLRYDWEQLSGTRVLFEPKNQQSSIVSFMVPSTFYGTGDANLVIRVTVSDPSGQAESREVRLESISRRHAALWGGIHGGEGMMPACPQGDCAGLVGVMK